MHNFQRKSGPKNDFLENVQSKQLCCQMVYYQTNYFGIDMAILSTYFTAELYILLPFVVIWNSFPLLVCCMYLEKFGNPGKQSQKFEQSGHRGLKSEFFWDRL
jgi:hypothetical protein